VPVTSGLADGLETGEAAAVDEDVAGAEDEEEEEDEDGLLLQAAAVRPRQAMPSTAAMRLAYVRLVSIPRR